MEKQNLKQKYGPGPAKYILPTTVGHMNHDISKSRSPSYSMGTKLPGVFSERNVTSPSPGPKYQVQYLTKFGRANVPILNYWPSSLNCVHFQNRDSPVRRSTNTLPNENSLVSNPRNHTSATTRHSPLNLNASVEILTSRTKPSPKAETQFKLKRNLSSRFTSSR